MVTKHLNMFQILILGAFIRMFKSKCNDNSLILKHDVQLHRHCTSGDCFETKLAYSLPLKLHNKNRNF